MKDIKCDLCGEEMSVNHSLFSNMFWKPYVGYFQDSTDICIKCDKRLMNAVLNEMKEISNEKVEEKVNG